MPFHNATRVRREVPSGNWRITARSLLFKASLLVVLLILVLTVTGNALSLRAMSGVLHEHEAEHAGDWASTLASNAAPAVAACDRSSLQQMANNLLRMDRVESVVFLDREGRLLAEATMSGAGLPAVTPEDLAGAAQHNPPVARLVRPGNPGHRDLEVMVPVRTPLQLALGSDRKSEILGYVRLGVDISDVQLKLNQTARLLWRAAVGVVLLVIPFSVLVTIYVISPLKELARTARAIAGGSMDDRANIRSRDEIGELAEAFNTMADRVAGSQFELLQLNADLERRVEERTRELEELASRDPLTGLYNRRHFGDVISREFAAAERYDADLTCLMFDVDHFKEINDHFGHRTGDAILIALAKSITSELRESDVAARFGGDEFIVLLPQTQATSAAVLADRIVAAFHANVSQSHPGLPATLSAGVASLRTTRARSSEALIHEADVALYAAKEAGRNRMVASVAAACA